MIFIRVHTNGHLDGSLGAQSPHILPRGRHLHAWWRGAHSSAAELTRNIVTQFRCYLGLAQTEQLEPSPVQLLVFTPVDLQQQHRYIVTCGPRSLAGPTSTAAKLRKPSTSFFQKDR